MLSLFGIFLGLGLLMYLALKGYSIIWVAPLCAAVVAFTGGLDIISTYMGPYMTGLVGFVKTWFPAFMLSAIFGNMMETTGAAKSIAIVLTKWLGAKFAIASIVISCAVLTLGGVSLFVVVFAIYPLALAIFKEANITRKLIPGAIGAVLNTSAAVGFGTVVRAVPGFAELTNILLSIPGNPLISLSVAVNLLAGATGSASGGMGIALAALGTKYLELSKTSGISAQAFHRIASLSSGGLDTLPHNGAVLTLLNNTGMTHKDSYIDIMVVSLIMPVVATVPAIILAVLGIY